MILLTWTGFLLINGAWIFCCFLILLQKVFSPDIRLFSPFVSKQNPVRFWAHNHLLEGVFILCLERFSFDLEMKTREQNRNDKQTEIERLDWFIERIQIRVAFGWVSERSGEKTPCPRTSRKSMDTSLWPHTATRLVNRTMLSLYNGFLWRKNEESMFDLFIHWPINQITNTYRSVFSRSYENRSKWIAVYISQVCPVFYTPLHLVKNLADEF